MSDEDYQRGFLQGTVMNELKEIRNIFNEHAIEDRRVAGKLEVAMENLTKEVQNFRDWRNKVVAVWGALGTMSGLVLSFLIDWLKK